MVQCFCGYTQPAPAAHPPISEALESEGGLRLTGSLASITPARTNRAAKPTGNGLLTQPGPEVS
jgi:hypothetical protein